MAVFPLKQLDFVFLAFLIQSNQISARPTIASDSNLEINREQHLFEGDIAGIDSESIQSADTMRNLASNGIRDEQKRWPNGVVPYVISDDFGTSQTSFNRRTVLTAMNGYKVATCIDFVERTNENDYILIKNGLGCSSFIGRIGGQQDVQINIPGCLGLGTIQHELMHALGFYHEQSRTDRDDYVDVNYSNIRSGMENNFLKYSDKEIYAFNQPYDFESVMHYGPYDFAADMTKYTIRPKAQFGDIEIGQRIGLSDVDVKKINLMYKCPPEISAPEVVPTVPATITTLSPKVDVVDVPRSTITQKRVKTTTTTTTTTATTPDNSETDEPSEPDTTTKTSTVGVKVSTYMEGNKNCTRWTQPNGQSTWKCSWNNANNNNNNGNFQLNNIPGGGNMLWSGNSVNPFGTLNGQSRNVFYPGGSFMSNGPQGSFYQLGGFGG